MNCKRITFHIFHNGEKNVGINGEDARVEMWEPTLEVLENTKRALQTTFSQIWNWPTNSINVYTDEELRRHEDEMDRLHAEAEADIERGTKAYLREIRGE